MRDWFRFLLFLALLVAAIWYGTGVFSTPFAIAASLIPLAIIISAIHQPTGGVIGYYFNQVGGDNNQRWVILLVGTIISGLWLVKYGIGEPIIPTMIREANSVTSEHTDGSFFNTVVYGKDESNGLMLLKRAYLSRAEGLERKDRGCRSEESSAVCREKTLNFKAYGVFVTDEMVEKVVREEAAKKPIFSISLKQEKRGLVDGWLADKGRSRFPLQLFCTFFLLTIIYTPFAFRDEALDFINKNLERLEARLDSSKGEVPKNEEGSGGGKKEDSVSELKRNVGTFAVLDIIMEFLFKGIKHILEGIR